MPPWRELFWRGLVGSAGLAVISPCVRRAENLFPKRHILRKCLFMQIAYPGEGQSNRLRRRR